MGNNYCTGLNTGWKPGYEYREEKEASGERCSSPVSSKKEYEILEKNQYNKRERIEIELSKIPINEQNNLNIFMYTYPLSDYTLQSFNIVILNKEKKFRDDKKKYSYYSPVVDLQVYPNIWNNFNLKPFYYKCNKCNNIHKNFSVNNICFTCNHKLKFGMYKNKTLQYILNNDKSYLEWLHKNQNTMNSLTDIDKNYINQIFICLNKK